MLISNYNLYKDNYSKLRDCAKIKKRSSLYYLQIYG